MTDEEIRDELAEQVWGVLVAAGLRDETRGPSPSVIAHAVVGNLLSTVRRVAEQRAAEELLNAAREDGISTHKLTPVEVLTLRVVKLEALFARAAALTATPNHGTDAT